MIGTLAVIVVAAAVVASVAFWLIGERGRPLLRSTASLFRQLGPAHSFSLRGLHTYVYARWTNQYISYALKHSFPRVAGSGRSWADTYHGKVLTHDQAASIIRLDSDIPLQDLEQIIPYPTARDLVLKGPPDVVAFECACRHARPNPCQPTQVCMVIGQPFADFILEHKPGASRRLTQAEALDLLQAEHDRGHLHSAWFKDAMLNRFYAICNCCACCCGALEAMTKNGSPMMASSGYVARIDGSLCTSCEACVSACPFGALSSGETISVGWEKCMGCGVCASQCTADAIELVRDERKGLPLDVNLLTGTRIPHSG